jgi:hypothetical protein
MAGLVWTLIVVLLVLWIFGFFLHVGGPLIHVLAVVALVFFIYNLLDAPRTRI